MEEGRWSLGKYEAVGVQGQTWSPIFVPSVGICQIRGRMWILTELELEVMVAGRTSEITEPRDRSLGWK